MAEYFVARQPIFDRNLNVYGYELLFRTSHANAAPAEMDDDMATASVLSTSDEIGLSHLVGECLAFINLPAKFLLEPDLLFIEAKDVVLEVLETVELDRPAVAGMADLTDRGYRLALDDVVDRHIAEDALPHLSIAKLDLPNIPREEWGKQIALLQGRGMKVVGEKVEVEEDFQYLRDLGCDYFQGYFFARPKVISGKRLPPNKLAVVELLSRISCEETEVDEISSLVSRDVAMSVRVMNYANSAASGLTRQLASIQEAVVYVGRETLRRWVSLSVMSGIDDKPNELLTMALSRARFMELVAEEFEEEDTDSYFTVGLFSMLDVFLDAEIESLLQPLGLTEDVERAITEHAGYKGLALRAAIDLERGAYDSLDEIDLDYPIIAELHLEANHWADLTVSGMAGS